uniref:Extradiol ring-cleavage dioxygenase class III enzyme subunit B domain-containing protein n=1 Tax=Tetradesmus obliquus TaxID=3088 RepID=A0A383W0E3_TETOB|eukprot:jgi/Sobl393_1/12138/SZX70961.1
MKTAHALQSQQPHRKALCTYYSSDSSQLVAEIRAAYRATSAAAAAAADCHPTTAAAAAAAGNTRSKLLAIVVPHGAACDGFHVAAHAYRRLAQQLQAARCSRLTAVLLGTEHRGTTPIALSRRDWMTPLGPAAVDAAAVEWLAAQHHLPINEAPHAAEHSIENQLPFLVHAAAWGWDLAAASCCPGPAEETAAAAAAGSSEDDRQQQQQQQQQRPAPASLTIVPISIGYLGQQPELIQQYGAAVAELLQHLRAHGSQQQQQQQQQCGQPGTARASVADAAAGSHQVVLIVSSDFTHAGPWYRELPPPGVSLADYMAAQDSPLLQAVRAGSVPGLLAAAAATRNSLCGLYPLAVALEALYGSSSSKPAADVPQLLTYSPAHLIFPRPDSTGFAAFAVYAK